MGCICCIAAASPCLFPQYGKNAPRRVSSRSIRGCKMDQRPVPKSRWLPHSYSATKGPVVCSNAILEFLKTLVQCWHIFQGDNICRSHINARAPVGSHHWHVLLPPQCVLRLARDCWKSFLCLWPRQSMSLRACQHDGRWDSSNMLSATIWTLR